MQHPDWSVDFGPGKYTPPAQGQQTLMAGVQAGAPCVTLTASAWQQPTNPYGTGVTSGSVSSRVYVNGSLEWTTDWGEGGAQRPTQAKRAPSLQLPLSAPSTMHPSLQVTGPRR